MIYLYTDSCSSDHITKGLSLKLWDSNFVPPDSATMYLNRSSASMLYVGNIECFILILRVSGHLIDVLSVFLAFVDDFPRVDLSSAF